METIKKRVLSGVQTSGVPTLGNYLGAIKRWVEMQEEYDCYFFLANLHALTVFIPPKELEFLTNAAMAFYVGAGLESEKSVLFCQSHVSAHAELGWILTTMTYMGELSRMTQFKDKSLKAGQNINAGLFTYPALMSADILLYKAHLVPTGEDQKQHLEITRDLAERFNQRYGCKTLRVPEPLIGKASARIMDLQNPLMKMSKSNTNSMGTIFLNDEDKVIAKKIKSAVTDSGTEIVYSDAKPGIANLIDIYSSITDLSVEEIIERYRGKMYGHLKSDLADIVVNALKPMRDKANELLANPNELGRIYAKGKEKACLVADQTLREVKNTMGIL